jgi:hypothetical protein
MSDVFAIQDEIAQAIAPAMRAAADRALTLNPSDPQPQFSRGLRGGRERLQLERSGRAIPRGDGRAERVS